VLTRLVFLLTIALFGFDIIGPAVSAVVTESPSEAREWTVFRQRYVLPEGRVVDTGSGGISHSEGQGYGLLFAVQFGDHATFNKLLQWTEATLQHRSDALHVWRFLPPPVRPETDFNNATDGDLFIAWALARAGDKWHDATYTKLAAAIARDILDECTVEFHGQLLLLPGAYGFQRPDGIVLNLSYYALDALRALSRVLPDPRWVALERDGLDIMRRARFGAWGLPADWVLVGADGTVQPASGWPARFSWDAIRIPLHLAWAGLMAPPLPEAVKFWTASDSPAGPLAWVDFGTGETSPFPGGAGIRAIMELSRGRLRGGQMAPSLPHVADADCYYAAALILLARIAATEPPEPPSDTGIESVIQPVPLVPDPVTCSSPPLSHAGGTGAPCVLVLVIPAWFANTADEQASAEQLHPGRPILPSHPVASPW
jgi:endoglucanase